MNKIISRLLIAFFVFNVIIAKSQITSERIKDDRFVFWFYVKADIKTDKKLKVPIYAIRRINKDVKSGTVKKFKKEVWRNLERGQQIAIGPFLELVDAERANEMYDLARKTDEQMDQDIEATIDTSGNEVYFWYLIQFEVSKRTKKFLIKRQPAATFPGSLKDFRFILWSVRTVPQLTIGPFTAREEAEESKRLYRLEDAF